MFGSKIISLGLKSTLDTRRWYERLQILILSSKSAAWKEIKEAVSVIDTQVGFLKSHNRIMISWFSWKWQVDKDEKGIQWHYSHWVLIQGERKFQLENKIFHANPFGNLQKIWALSQQWFRYLCVLRPWRIKVPKDAQDVLVEYPARVISVSVLVAVV